MMYVRASYSSSGQCFQFSHIQSDAGHYAHVSKLTNAHESKQMHAHVSKEMNAHVSKLQASDVRRASVSLSVGHQQYVKPGVLVQRSAQHIRNARRNLQRLSAFH
jgi:hypothetical protein